MRPSRAPCPASRAPCHSAPCHVPRVMCPVSCAPCHVPRPVSCAPSCVSFARSTLRPPPPPLHTPPNPHPNPRPLHSPPTALAMLEIFVALQPGDTVAQNGATSAVGEVGGGRGGPAGSVGEVGGGRGGPAGLRQGGQVTLHVLVCGHDSRPYANTSTPLQDTRRRGPSPSISSSPHIPLSGSHPDRPRPRHQDHQRHPGAVGARATLLPHGQAPPARSCVHAYLPQPNPATTPAPLQTPAPHSLSCKYTRFLLNTHVFPPLYSHTPSFPLYNTYIHTRGCVSH